MSTTDASRPELGDSVVAEVRRIREQIDAEVGHDLRRLAERVRRDAAEVRAQHGLIVAEIPPRRPGARKTG